MNMSYRVFFFDESGKVFRIPNPKYDRAYRNQEPLQQFAGQRVRLLFLFIELKHKKPYRVVRADTSILWFDRKGVMRSDKEIKHMHLHLMVGELSAKSNRTAREEKALQRMLEDLKEWEWTPTPSEKATVEKLLWPKGGR